MLCLGACRECLISMKTHVSFQSSVQASYDSNNKQLCPSASSSCRAMSNPVSSPSIGISSPPPPGQSEQQQSLAVRTTAQLVAAYDTVTKNGCVLQAPIEAVYKVFMQSAPQHLRKTLSFLADGIEGEPSPNDPSVLKHYL